MTSGDQSLSRTAHAKHALEFFGSIDWCVTAMANEIDPDGTMADDRAWLISFADEIVSLAFNAGAHARAAIGKEVEGHAVRGLKMLSNSREGGHARKLSTAGKTTEVLKRMAELIEQGHSVSRAATLAADAGLGTSAGANRQLYNRHHPK